MVWQSTPKVSKVVPRSRISRSAAPFSEVLGGIVGRHRALKQGQGESPFPCKTNKLAREIPACRWCAPCDLGRSGFQDIWDERTTQTCSCRFLEMPENDENPMSMRKYRPREN